MRALEIAAVFTLACSSAGQSASDFGLRDVDTPEHWDFWENAADTFHEMVSEDAAGEEPEAFVYPDPAFVHVIRTQPVVSANTPYTMDKPVQYRTQDALPETDVRALSAVQGMIWVGTAKGIFYYDEKNDKFLRVLLGGPWDLEPIKSLGKTPPPGGDLLVVQSGAFHIVKGDGQENWFTVTHETGMQELVAGEAGAAALWLATTGGELWRVNVEPTRPMEVEVVAQGLGSIRDVAVDTDGVVWVATAEGLRLWDGKSVSARTAKDGWLLDDDVRAVVALKGGGVVAGTAKGVALLLPGGPALVTAGIGGLPTDDLRALACDLDGCLIGHGIGATYLVIHADGSTSEVNHYVSERWLPADAVTAVARDNLGRLWVGTPKGISRISWEAQTFAEKAEYMESLQEAHFWRLGFVPSDLVTDDPWSPSEWRVWDHDNDGLWTQMQIGAWCYAYAVTGNERYYQKARKAMDMIFLQIDIPAVDFEAAGLGRGFITRSLVRDDEGPIFESKKTQKNWHLVHWKDGHDYFWKDDTSSDETTGHFFGFPLFYDLCAKDEKEREEVAEYAAALADYIVRNGFKLIDLDGQPTTFGHWEPERLAAAVDGLEPCMEKAKEAPDPTEAITACIGSWFGEGWLNSVEILGHLLATWHMTGDPKFYDAYELLITKYRYDEMAMPHKDTVTITNPALMNHSDHELAMLAYHTLIRYEPNEERRKKWIEGLLFLYEHELGERNPLWAAIVALTAGPEHAQVSEALQSLREMPFDRREWYLDNSHRKDALDWPDERFGKPQFDRVFPYDEIRTVWWNSNLRVKKFEGDGRVVSGPMAWLLPYWAMRYAGIIGE